MSLGWFSPSVLECLCSEAAAVTATRGVRSVPGQDWGWVSAGFGISEHKSNIYLTFLSLSTGRRASSSAGNLSGPFALVQRSGLSQLGLPVAGLGRCLLSAAAGGCVEGGRSILRWGREQDVVPHNPEWLQ